MQINSEEEKEAKSTSNLLTPKYILFNILGKDPTSLSTFDKRESMKHWKSRSNIFMSTWPKIRKDAEDLPASDDITRVMKARLLADKMMRE